MLVTTKVLRVKTEACPKPAEGKIQVKILCKLSRLGRVVHGQPRVSMKFDFRSESFKRKLSKIIFFYKMMIGCFEKKKIIRKRLLN